MIPRGHLATAVTTARVPGRVARLAAVVQRSASSAAQYVIAPHRASLKRLADIPLTVVGIGLGDFAAFHISHGWGFAVTAGSLVVLEHMIADDDTPGSM